MDRLANDIYVWRVTYRLSQDAAAALIGASGRQWRRWESGYARPSEDNYNSLMWLISQPPAGWLRG